MKRQTKTAKFSRRFVAGSGVSGNCFICTAAIWYQRNGCASKSDGPPAVDQRFFTFLIS